MRLQIIQTVDHNRHEDAALHRSVGNAQTMSGQRTYHKRPVAQSIVIRQYYVSAHLVRSSRTLKRRNRCAKLRYSSQYARLNDVNVTVSLIPG